MTLEEIPADEQLMGLTSVPAVQQNMQFFFKGLIWPTPDRLNSQIDKAAQANSRLLNESSEWIRRVVKPEFVAPDLSSRLQAARSIVSNEDAFLVRYRMNGSSIQIVVTRFHLHLVFAPIDNSPVAAMHRYLRLDETNQGNQWEAPWQVGQVQNLTFGYQARSTPADWRESIYYLTNGRAVKYSLQKLDIQAGDSHGSKGFVAPTEEAERNWFNLK